jgi:hypothetical protein
MMKRMPARMPRNRVGGAMISGVRFFHSQLQNSRACLFGIVADRRGSNVEVAPALLNTSDISGDRHDEK